jgi:hypothetical protein
LSGPPAVKDRAAVLVTARIEVAKVVLGPSIGGATSWCWCRARARGEGQKRRRVVICAVCFRESSGVPFQTAVLHHRAIFALNKLPRRLLSRVVMAAGLCALGAHALAQTAPATPQSQQPETPAVQPMPPAPPVDEPWRTDRFYLETSVYTHHWTYDPAHDDHQDLILGEWNITPSWLVGASYFKNSFGQPTEYVYGGYRFRPFESAQPLYIKVSAGLVYGYKYPYKDKIPFNSSGIAPVIIPSVGYCINRFCGEAVIVGTASIILTLGVTIP